jgi:hypothetical protein
MSLRLGNSRRTSAMAVRQLAGLDWLKYFVADFQTSLGRLFPSVDKYRVAAERDRRGA